MSERWLIADFARRCRLPVSTLRYYDRIGLLPPARVDPVTGYRHYTADQLPTATLIERLRGLGTTPERIAAVLRGGGDAAAALSAERQRVAGEIRAGREALAELRSLARTLGAPGPAVAGPPEPASVRCDLPSRTVAGRPVVLPADRLAAGLRAAALDLWRAAGRPPAARFGAVLPLDLGDPVEGTVFLRAADAPVGVMPRGTADRVVLPAGPALRLTSAVPLHRLPAAYAVLLAAVGPGHEPAGTVIEEYEPGARAYGEPLTRPILPLTRPQSPTSAGVPPVIRSSS